MIKQYQALLKVEGVELEFTKEAIEEIAQMAYDLNQRLENIGARRLYTVLEKLLEEVSFNAPDIAPTKVVITPEYVREKLGEVISQEELAKFIL
jgi:ATP-dependent HslUV protease ATP-binding subunit HslU